MRLAKFILSLVLFSNIISCADAPKPIKEEKDIKLSISNIKNLPSKPVLSLQAGDGYSNQDTRVSLAVDSSNSIFYTADSSGKVIALDIDSKKVIWSKKIAKTITSGPILAADKLYVGTGDARLFAINANDGEVLWNISTSSEILSTPAFSNGVVYVHTLDSALSAYDVKQGNQLWRLSLNMPSLSLRKGSSPVVTTSHVIVGFSNGKLAGINKLTGALEWTQEIANPTGKSELQRMVDISADPLLVGDKIFAVSYQGKLSALTNIDGQLLWDKSFSSHVNLAANDTVVFAVNANGKIEAASQETGATFWLQEELLGLTLSSPTVIGEHLAVADNRGNLYFLSTKDGVITGKINVSGNNQNAPMLVDNDKLFILNQHGRLMAFDMSKL